MKRMLQVLLLLGWSWGWACHAGVVWQWSVPMGQGRAFLWIPERCQRVRAVVVGQNNMLEQGILEHSLFRKSLVGEGMAEVFIAPPFDFVFQFDRDAGERFNDLMRRLAAASGYSELEMAPVVPLGHSACASFPWNFAAWNPERTLAVLSVHGDAPLTRLTGSGRPNPDWGKRNLDGVPGLMVMAEYEWSDARLLPALQYREHHPKTPLAMLAEPGNGHFNCSDRLVKYLAMFVRKAAELRLPADNHSGGASTLKPIDPTRGWLVERWHLNQPRSIKPAQWKQYRGEAKEAFWAFDKEMAWATQDYMADQPGKLPQLLSVTDGQMLPDDGCGEPVTPRFLPLADGVTFQLKTAFMSAVPGDAHRNQNAARWAYLPAGSPLGHASGGGAIELHTIVGPVNQVGADTFRFCMSRVNSTEDRRNLDLWVWAGQAGDARYKSMVQQAMIRVPLNTEGIAQHITFPVIPDQQAGTKAVPLGASSDAGTKVEYYVREGPAEVSGDTLRFTPVPPRAAFPLKVAVVAWQHGLAGEHKIRTATPVTREFFILNSAAMRQTTP